MVVLLEVIAFVCSILYAKGWLFGQNLENAVALIALGLLIPPIAAALMWRPTIRPARKDRTPST